MPDIHYGERLLGFVHCEAGIPREEWLAFASQRQGLVKQPPHEGIDPFTRQPRAYHNANYFVVEGGAQVGLAVWEDSACIGIAGDRIAMRPFIELLCATFASTFSPVERD